jgi:hypothetical protein
MSYNLYKARANEVIKDSNKIENLEERVEYLIKAKREFTANNSGYEVGLIVSMYDSAIEETKFILQQKQNKPPENNNDISKIIHHKPPKITAEKLKPELQSIFDQLPGIIEYCERGAQRFSKEIVKIIIDEIDLAPDEREQIIKTYRDKARERYKELTQSGLRLTATDNEEILQDIGLRMFATGTWELPMPKDCGFSSLKPDPKGYFHAMLEPIFKSYAVIQACNKLLIQPTTDTPDTPAPELETTEQKIKRLLEPLRGAFDSPEHIDIIINAFIKLKAGENLQKVNKAILYNMELKEFIKPFGSLFAEEMFKRGEITKTLLFYIEKNTVAGEPEYSEGYINRLLSECRSK